MWRAFRWSGRGTLFVAALTLYAFVHVNQIGLPGFAKRPLLEQLRERGVELDFSRMRVRLGRGIVIEQVNLSRAREPAGEQVFAEQLQLKLKWADLLRLEPPTITTVLVRGGQVTVPVAGETNTAAFRFAVQNIQARLRFVSPELWALEQFEGTCHGGTFKATGSLTNASRLRRKSEPKPASDRWQPHLLRLGRTLNRLTFGQPPELTLAFQADLRDPGRSTAELHFHAAAARVDEVRLGEVNLAVALNQPPATNGLMALALRLDARQARTPWADVEALRLTTDFDLAATNPLPSRLSWKLDLSAPKTRWAQAGTVRIAATSWATNPAQPGEFVTKLSLAGTGVATEWATTSNLLVSAAANHRLVFPVTNWFPSRLGWTSRLDQVHTRWSDAGALSVIGEVRPVATTEESIAGLPPILAALRRWRLAADLAVTNLASPNLELTAAATHLDWAGDRLALAGLRAHLYGGAAEADATVNVSTRQLEASAATAFDLHRLAPLLGPAAQKWLAQYGWSPRQPVALEATAGTVLPDWTHAAPDWAAELLAPLRLAGLARVTNFSYRGVAGSSALVPFSHTNRVWTIRNAQVTRPEGRLDFDLTEWSVRRDYHFHIRSTLDPQAAVPLLSPEAARAFANVQFTLPPRLEGDIWGRWHEPERTGVRASLAATNLTVRGEAAAEFRAAEVTYTNRWLQVRDADIRQGTNAAHVEALGFDLAGDRLFFTNAVSTLDPGSVTRAVGPKTALALEPYVFATPPHVILNGIIPTRGNVEDANVSFETQAGGVRWWKLAASRLNTTVWWRGQTVSLTNLDADFHGGRLTGNVFVDLAEMNETRFRFDSAFTDVQLRSLLADVVPRTNRIEGLVSGHLIVDEAHSRTNGPWLGRGEARLRDGFLWDLPLFGGLSAALDRIVPGIGQTRFNSGSSTFTITNRLIRTQDLEFRSSTMRLASSGSVDFDTHLDATMRAEVLRDVPLLGPVVSLALSPFAKLFQFDVRGTLEKPVTELRYVPELLLAPLRPFETIRSLFPDAPGKAGTAPAPPKVGP